MLSGRKRSLSLEVFPTMTVTPLSLRHCTPGEENLCEYHVPDFAHNKTPAWAMTSVTLGIPQFVDFSMLKGVWHAKKDPGVGILRRLVI